MPAENLPTVRRWHRFSATLRMGMDRTAVNKYLDSQKVDYHAVGNGGSNAEKYEITIGEEPGGLVCEPWTVYIALEFDAAEKLREVHVTKEGTCL